MHPHPAFILLNLRALIVEDLGRQALYLPDDRIILIDSAADLQRVADWTLTQAARDPSGTPGLP